MFIKKLLIKNFQSHKSSSIEFDKGLNCVVGSTNSGKSSVIRAIKFILFGEPWEKSFVRKGHSSTKIDVQIGDHLVERTKGEEVNEYILDKVKYQNFGVSVPSDIKNALRLNTIDFDGDTINLNFADQLDSLFLIDESDTVKAKLLNKLSGLDIIDNVMKGISDDKRACASEIKTLDKDNAETKEILRKYIDIDEKKKAIYELDIMTGEFEQAYLKIDKLYKIRDDISGWKEQKAEIKILEDRMDKLVLVDTEKIESQIEEVKETNESIEMILQSKGLFKTLNSEVKELVSKSEQYELIDIDKIESIFDSYEELNDIINSVVHDKGTLEVGKKQIEELEIRLKRTEEYYYTTLEKYKDALKESKTCPTCGTKMTKEAIEQCLKTL